jgi:hypothetical protein
MFLTTSHRQPRDCFLEIVSCLPGSTRRLQNSGLSLQLPTSWASYHLLGAVICYGHHLRPQTPLLLLLIKSFFHSLSAHHHPDHFANFSIDILHCFISSSIHQPLPLPFRDPHLTHHHESRVVCHQSPTQSPQHLEDHHPRRSILYIPVRHNSNCEQSHTRLFPTGHLTAAPPAIMNLTLTSSQIRLPLQASAYR